MGCTSGIGENLGNLDGDCFLRVDPAEMVTVYWLFDSFLGGGFDLRETVKRIEKSVESPVMRRVFHRLGRDLDAGVPPSIAFAKFPRVFDQTFLVYAQTAEKTGLLAQFFGLLARARIRTEKLRSSLGHWLVIYPRSFCVIWGMVSIMLISLLDTSQFAWGFEPAQSPLLIRVFLVINEGILFLLGGGTAFYIFGGGLFRLNPGWKDRLFLSFPVIGRIVKDHKAVSFCRSLGILIESGVPILSALESSGEIVQNRFLQLELDGVRSRIRSGKSLVSALEGSDFLSTLSLKRLRAGEEMGTLPHSLAFVADCLEAETDRKLELVAGLMPPLLLIAQLTVILLSHFATYLAWMLPINP